MGFRYSIDDQQFDKTYMVWQRDKMKEDCKQPGVYVLFDINGEVLYIGESQIVGKRVSDHITGSKQSQRGFQKRICTIRIYLFEKTPVGKTDMKMCEHWIKRELPPIYSKDGYLYDSRDTINYSSDVTTLWKNWHKHDYRDGDKPIDGKKYQDYIKAAKIKL